MYSPFRHIGSVFLKAPIQLTFFLTRQCDCLCKHCFYLSGSTQAYNKQQELSLHEIEKISASMGDLLWLAFSGGEIFLRDDLVEIVKTFYKNNRPAIILLPTNGIQTDNIREKTEKILDHCKNSVVTLKLSVDGDEVTHDSIRGVEGSFQKAMDTYKALEPALSRYSNFEMGVNTVFCCANQNKMKEIIDYVKGMESIRTHTISLVRGDVSDESLKDIDINKYEEAIRILESNIKKGLSGKYNFYGARLKAAQDILQRRLILKTVRDKEKVVDCYAGRLTLVLTESGDLYPCESFSMKIGNVRDNGYDLKKMSSSVKAHDILSSISDNGCYCTHECYLMMNILFNPMMYPALLKEYANIR